MVVFRLNNQLFQAVRATVQGFVKGVGFFVPKRYGQVGLDIEVDKQHPLVLLCKRQPQVQACRGFRNAAFLVADRHDVPMVVPFFRRCQINKRYLFNPDGPVGCEYMLAL